MTDQTAVATEDAKPAPTEGAAEAPGAQDGYEAALDKFNKAANDSGQQQTAPAGKPAAPASETISREEAQKIADEAVRTALGQQKDVSDLETISREIAEGTGMSQKMARAWLKETAEEDKRLAEAWLKRLEDPAGWSKVQGELAKRFREENKDVIDARATEDRRAVNAAVHSATSASQQLPEGEKPRSIAEINRQRKEDPAAYRRFLRSKGFKGG